MAASPSNPDPHDSLRCGAVIVDPASGRVFLGHDSVGLVELEAATGNSMIRSL